MGRLHAWAAFYQRLPTSLAIAMAPIYRQQRSPSLRGPTAVALAWAAPPALSGLSAVQLAIAIRSSAATAWVVRLSIHRARRWPPRLVSVVSNRRGSVAEHAMLRLYHPSRSTSLSNARSFAKPSCSVCRTPLLLSPECRVTARATEGTAFHQGCLSALPVNVSPVKPSAIAEPAHFAKIRAVGKHGARSGDERRDCMGPRANRKRASSLPHSHGALPVSK